MNLEEFHNLVSQEINRGSTFDALIPEYTRRAARWIERNYSFKWMERFVRFQIKKDDTYPRSISVPGDLKAINFIRFFTKSYDKDGNLEISQTETGKPFYTYQIDPEDEINVQEGVPRGYWIDGMEYIWFDKIPTEDLLGQMSYIQYTAWPADFSKTPTLLRLGEDVLLAQTIVMMAPRMRNPVLREMYTPLLETGLTTLIKADEELRASERNEYMEMDDGIGDV